MLALLSGCAATQKPVPPAATIQTSVSFPADDLGRTVNLKAPAKRVIVIGPGAIETVYALNAQKQIIARDSWTPQIEAAKKLPVAGDYRGPNVEQSIVLRPDLVIVQGETYDQNRAGDWQTQIGAPVAILTPRDLKTVRSEMEKIGAWLGKSGAAKKLAATLIFAAPPPNGPTAFIETGDAPLYTAGPDTLVGQVLEAAGFVNAVSVKGYQPYNVESLLAAPPDFYIVPSEKTRAQILNKLRKSPALSKLECVRKGRVIVMDGDLILRPGPRLKLGIEGLRRERMAQAP